MRLRGRGTVPPPPIQTNNSGKTGSKFSPPPPPKNLVFLFVCLFWGEGLPIGYFFFRVFTRIRPHIPTPIIMLSEFWYHWLVGGGGGGKYRSSPPPPPPPPPGREKHPFENPFRPKIAPPMKISRTFWWQTIYEQTILLFIVFCFCLLLTAQDGSNNSIF